MIIIMKKNEEYWLNLYKEGKIEIDFETGQVWSYLSGNKHLLGSHHKDKNKYMQSSAGPTRKERYHILLHRLVWICANGEIPDEINHKNGIKSDNRLDNLELTDKSGNALHSYRVLGNKGGVTRGEDSVNAILTEEKVIEIRKRYIKGIVGLKFLAKEYGVAWPTIADVVKRKSWRHI
jgi:hypothetical protein